MEERTKPSGSRIVRQSLAGMNACCRPAPEGGESGRAQILADVAGRDQRVLVFHSHHHHQCRRDVRRGGEAVEVYATQKNIDIKQTSAPRDAGVAASQIALWTWVLGSRH